MLRYVKQLAVVSGILGALVVAGGLLPRSAEADATGARVVKNPYENVNWDRVIPLIANLHSHTVYSDGRAEPEQLIHNYAEAGYHILSITDHDNYHTTRPEERETEPTHETTWPWTRWIAEEPSQIWERDGVESAAFFPSLGEQGMLAIRGNELTSDPHIVSLFNPCGFTERIRVPDADHDRERFACVEQAGGLSYWAHPAHYVPGGSWADRGFAWNEGIEHFGSLVSEFDSLLGIEFQLGGQRELEEELFDRLLAAYYRDHDIFIKGSDDTHGTSVPANATLTIVLAEELTEPAVRRALENGHKFVGSRVDVFPVFNRITVDEEAKTISLDIENHDGVTWIKNGETHHEGESIDYSRMQDAILRFEVKVDDMVFYSQAFYVD